MSVTQLTTAALRTTPVCAVPKDNASEVPDLLSGKPRQAAKCPCLPASTPQLVLEGHEKTWENYQRQEENESTQIPTSSWSHAGNI